MQWHGNFTLSLKVKQIIHFERVVTPQNIPTSDLTVLLEQSAPFYPHSPQPPNPCDYIDVYSPPLKMSSFHGGTSPVGPNSPTISISCRTKSVRPMVRWIQDALRTRQDVYDFGTGIGNCYNNDKDSIPWVCSRVY